MSKRVDSLSTSSSSHKNVKQDSSFIDAKSLSIADVQSRLDHNNTDLSLDNKRKAKRKLKTIKSMSNFSLSATDSAGSSSNLSCNNLQLDLSSLTASSSTSCYNSIIETNSINKIFEEKFSKKSEEDSKSDLISLRSSKFKKKFERLKKLNKLVNANNDMNESKLDIVDYNACTKSLRVVTKTKPLKLARKSPKLPTMPMSVQGINLSQLQHLSLRNLGVSVIKPQMLNDLLKNFTCLKYLDVSNCCTNQLHYSQNNSNPCQDETTMKPVINTKQLVGTLDGLLSVASTLTHLLIADLAVDDAQANLSYLLQLKQLKHLDISNCREKCPLNVYKNPSLLLAKLVYHLTSLRSLDISGRNFGGSIVFKEIE
jgi:hypothetical protein